MYAIVPRPFTDADGDPVDAGYHNATLGTTGVALRFPPGARRAVVQVSAGCFIGVRNSDTLDTFSDDNYGSILNGYPLLISKGVAFPSDSSTYLHIAPWSGTAAVAIAYV
jgi:hypothetical protein